MKSLSFAALLMVILLTTQGAASPWPAPKAPAVPHADGYVIIPDAAVAPEKDRTYRAVFDATRAADRPTDLLPALNMVGSEVNALAAAGVPIRNARFVVVFHGPAINGILTDANYRARYGIGNPNLKVLDELKKAGVDLFVCGQNLAFDQIDPASLSSNVTVAADALIVLMTYANDGYAILSF